MAAPVAEKGRRHTMRYVLSLAAFVLTGCSSPATQFHIENVSRLAVGMTSTQVAGILGIPQLVIRDPVETERQTWSYASGSILASDARAVSLSFDGTGNLISVPGITPAQ